MLIVGEAGIGKSRLLRECVARLGDDAHVASGAAVPVTGGAVPYGVVSTVLEDLVEEAGVEWTREVFRADFDDLAALVTSLGDPTRVLT